MSSAPVAFETSVLTTLSGVFSDEEVVHRMEDLLTHYNYFQGFFSETQSQRLIQTIAQTMVRKRIAFLTGSPPAKASTRETPKQTFPKETKAQKLAGAMEILSKKSAVDKLREQQQGEEWTCATCTYANSSLVKNCAVCEQPNLS